MGRTEEKYSRVGGDHEDDADDVVPTKCHFPARLRRRGSRRVATPDAPVTGKMQMTPRHAMLLACLLITAGRATALPTWNN